MGSSKTNFKIKSFVTVLPSDCAPRFRELFADFSVIRFLFFLELLDALRIGCNLFVGLTRDLHHINSADFYSHQIQYN
jgi:hypothetical protein